jgi:hydroxyacylglutathione hydrolase
LIVDAATAAARLGELARELALIGIDKISGFFDAAEVTGRATILQMTPTELAPRLASVTVVDVRSANEWNGGHLPGATHIPLGYLLGRLADLPRDRPVVVQCQSGGRSSIAASILERAGFRDVSNLTGGLGAWTAAGLPLDETARLRRTASARQA